MRVGFCIFLIHMCLIPNILLPVYGDVLYHDVSTGGNIFSSSPSSIIYPCNVYASITVNSISYNGGDRNNPDGTFYPGDAFTYVITTWYTANLHCDFFQPCPLHPSSHTSLKQSCMPHRFLYDSDFVIYGDLGSKSNSGTFQIPIDATNSNVSSIIKKAYVKGYSCFKHERWQCGWTTYQTTISFKPKLVDASQFQINIEFVTLQDSDGYDSRNLDDTFYPHDPIVSQHTISYPWKNERLKTLFVSLRASAEPLKTEHEFRCATRDCPHTVSFNNYTLSTRHYHYADGYTIHNATSYDLLGIHDIVHTASIQNIQQILWKIQSNEAVHVVKYNPKFKSYPFISFIDGHQYADENRFGIALKYIGVLDDGQIYSERRSKINNVHSVSYGLYNTQIHILSNLKNNSWIGSTPFNFPNNESSNHFVHSATSGMFYYDGYAIIYYTADNIREQLQRTEYSNVTIPSTLSSLDFAGRNVTWLAHNTIKLPIEPNTIFRTDLSIQRTGSNNNSTIVQITPHMKPGVLYIDDYLSDKALYDTNDTGLAEIVKNSTYSTNLTTTSTRDNFVVPFFKTAVYYYDRNASQNTPVPAYNATDAQWYDYYLRNNHDAILKSPRFLGMILGAPYTISIQNNNFTSKLSLNQFTHVKNLTIHINQLLNNTLIVSQNTDVLTLHPDDTFYPITALFLNGTKLNINCEFGCTIPINPNYGYTLDAINIWGGKAHASISPNPTPRLSFSYSVMIDGVLAAMLIISAFFLSKKLFFILR